MYKNLFGTGSFILAFVATIAGLMGVVTFENIQIEAVGLTTFEFMIYFTTLMTGIYGLLASHQTPFLRGLAQKAMNGGKNGIYSAACGIIGSLLGLTTYAIFLGSWVDAFMGLFLSVYLVLMAFMPIKWSNEVHSQSENKLNNYIREFKHTKVFTLINLTLIFAAIYGFTALFGR